MTNLKSATRLSAVGQAQIDAEFNHQFEAGLHPSAALAVYVDGKLAVDLVAGVANPANGRPAGPDSLFRVFSCGKPLVAACLWVLHERGKLSWDDPVVKHWPEFGARGKGRVTVRQVLTHSAGLPTTPAELKDRRDFADWGRCVAAMENAGLEFEPGSRVQYHSGTFGWLVGELVSRTSGRPFNDFFMDHVAAPLGLRETFFSLPQEMNGRVVKLATMPGFEDIQTAPAMNDERSYGVVFPAGGCITSARDIARFYAALAAGGQIDGVPWLKPGTVSDVTASHAEGVDQSSGRYLRWTLGMALSGEPPNRYGSAWGSRTFGHGGLASSVSWADPDLGAAMAYIASGLQPDPSNHERLHAMSAAVRAGVAL